MSNISKIYASLHMHSTHSDGEYSPAELVKIAKEEGYRALSVTDHDTVTANEELAIECKKAGLESIFGCEFSTTSTTTGLWYHITAFHFDPEHPEMREYLDNLSEKETHQTRVLFHRGVDIGYIKGITWEEVLEYNKGITWLCNNHVFQAMKAKGLITDNEYNDFFKTCYGVHRDEVPPCFEFKSTEEVIELIHRAGGIACVAHPKDRLHTIEQLVKMGIDGIEVWHNTLNGEERKEALSLAQKYDLFVSGGADHEGLLGGCYSYHKNPKETCFWAPPRSLGTTEFFYEEIRDRKKNPDRNKIFNELLLNDKLWKSTQKMKFKFDVDEDFYQGINRLADVLDFEVREDGIDVTAVHGDKIGVTFKHGKAVIYYKDKVQFFRGISHLADRVGFGSFEIFEDGFFDTVSAMIDVSRGGVPTVKSVKSLIDHMALMGYNMIMLYTEDLIELKSRPYFGYMRGRYSLDELKDIDDYAYEYGMEAIPCLECCGHMERYLKWGEASAIRDTSSVLLAREPKTFEFLEELISTAASAFRSKRIHIGMDEALDIGRGAFLNKHGYVPPLDIFNEFMHELVKITDKYGLRPMMWSDMYFRLGGEKLQGYYGKDVKILDDVKSKIPKNVDLVFWHYGEEPGCDDYMIKKHQELDRNIIFGGGNWGWVGHFPENNYAMSTNRCSIAACRNNNVKEAMMTIWHLEVAECDLFSNLYCLSYFSELCYNVNPEDRYINSRFEATTGGSFELFYKMSYYHNDFERDSGFESDFNKRFLGKTIFWQDIMEGFYDTHCFEKKMSEHYKMSRDVYKNARNDAKWGYLYDFAFCVFDYLAVKSKISEELVPAYKSNDRAMLKKIAEELLPQLKEKITAVHKVNKLAWFRNNKIFGWNKLDVRYSGLNGRCETAKELITAYLDGEIDKLDELEDPRLHRELSGFVSYQQITAV